MEGTLHLGRPPKEAAQTIVSGLEGAMLVARPYGDVSRFQAVANALLVSLTSPVSARARVRERGWMNHVGVTSTATSCAERCLLA